MFFRRWVDKQEERPAIGERILSAVADVVHEAGVGVALEGKDGERFPMRGVQMMCSFAPRKAPAPKAAQPTVQQKRKALREKKKARKLERRLAREAEAEQQLREDDAELRGLSIRMYMEMLEQGMPMPKRIQRVSRRDKKLPDGKRVKKRRTHPSRRGKGKGVPHNLSPDRIVEDLPVPEGVIEEGSEEADRLAEEGFEDDDEDEDDEADEEQFPRTLSPAERAMEMALMGEDYWGRQQSAKHWRQMRKEWDEDTRELEEEEL